MRRFALLSAQGTACSETVLTADEYPRMCQAVEAQINPRDPDAPVPGTWTDVTDNEACEVTA